jgi:hypothetical protein
MVVVDLGDLSFIQSLLLRDREADVASIPAVGDPRVADAHRFLGRMIKHALGPERAVGGPETGQQVGGMGKDGAEVRGLTIDSTR